MGLQVASGAGEMLEFPTVLIPPTKQFSTERMTVLPFISTARALLELTWITHFGALMVMEAFPVSCSAACAVRLSAITQ